VFALRKLIRKHRDEVVHAPEFYEEKLHFDTRMRDHLVHKMEEEQEHSPMVPFYPLHIYKELCAIMVAIVLLLALVSVFPHDFIGEKKADPIATPGEIKPPWYFQTHFGILRSFVSDNPTAGTILRTVAVLAPPIFFLALFLVPFIDRRKERDWARRPIFNALVVITIILGIYWATIGFGGIYDIPLSYLY